MQMDQTKQPGIACELVVLSKVEFWRAPQVDAATEDRLDFQYNVNLPEGSNQAVCSLTAIYQKFGTTDRSLQAKAEIQYTGMFRAIEGAENLALAEFTRVNAAAILLPYIRTRLHDLSVAGGR